MSFLHRLPMAAFLLALCGTSFAAPPEGFPTPTASPTTFAPVGEYLLVADTRAGALFGGTFKGQLSAVATGARVRAVGGAERSGAVAILGDPGGVLRALLLSGGKPGASVELKPAEPLKNVTDVAAHNEIIWVLQQDPPTVALFGMDGAELSRSDLTPFATAPFALALAPSGECYVTDPLGARILVLDQFGVVKAVMELSGTGYTRPTSLALDREGRLYVGDTVLGEVGVFTVKDKKLARTSSPAPLKLEDPLRLAFSGEWLWALQGWSARVVRFPAR